VCLFSCCVSLQNSKEESEAAAAAASRDSTCLLEFGDIEKELEQMALSGTDINDLDKEMEGLENEWFGDVNAVTP